MKPIAQTFIVNEPETGIDVIYITKVDLFFRTKSSTIGIELQIRETENGFPTTKTVPYATKILESVNVNTSTDASAATTFVFETPVILRTNEQFALVLIPLGGNPDYNVWIAELSGIDATTKNPIINNNQLGSLFISSNDLNFTPIQSESMKYTLYTAEFTAGMATAVFKNNPSEYFEVHGVIGDFKSGEQVVMSNNYLQLSSLTISGSNTYTIGEKVFQPAGISTANLTQATAYGTVYYANTSKILMSNTYGAFNVSDTLRSVTTNQVSAQPSFANQTVVTTSACNVIYVPDANTALTTDYVVNNYIYIGKNTGANVQILKITAVNSTLRTLTVANTVNFSDGAAIIGRVKGDGSTLFGKFTHITHSGGIERLISLSMGSKVSTTINFANSESKMLIGASSGATAKISSLIDLAYESITSLLPALHPNQTHINFSFKGTAEESNKTFDSTSTAINNEIPYEFVDKTRITMSRSNELQNPPSAGIAHSSLLLMADLHHANTKISPYIDTIRSSVTTTHNLIVHSDNLEGVIISYDSSNGHFYPNDEVRQANSTVTTTGKVIAGNGTILYISGQASSNVLALGRFSIANTQLYNINRGYTATIDAVRRYSESINTNILSTRYISKNVILADQQDAEDMTCYISAYRPVGASLTVFGKFLAGSDSDTLSNRDWSLMTETTSTLLTSSSVNRDDIVELVYSLPTSLLVLSNNSIVSGVSNTTGSPNVNNATPPVSLVTNVVTVSSSNGFKPGDFIYLSDNNTTAAGSYNFNVRQLIAVANNSSLTLSSPASFTSANCAVGRIPNLQSQYGAFTYANNGGIIRYTTTSDGVFDTYKTFATKIVLTSSSFHIVPRMLDMRCLALQV